MATNVSSELKRKGEKKMDIKAELMGLEADITQIIHFIYRAHILLSKATEETVIFPWERKKQTTTETMQTQQIKEAYVKDVLLETADEDLALANDFAEDFFEKFETLIETLKDPEPIKEI